MTKEDWFKYYSEENKKILDYLNVIKFGFLSIDIHEGKAVNAYLCQKTRLQKGKNNATDFAKLRAMAQK